MHLVLSVSFFKVPTIGQCSYKIKKLKHCDVNPYPAETESD